MSYAQASNRGSNEAPAVGHASGSRLGTALGTGNQQALAQADNRTEAELLASTRRSLAEAQAVSNRTLGTLDSQTEQLHRITAGADDVSNNLDKSEFLLQSLKPFGWVKIFSRMGRILFQQSVARWCLRAVCRLHQLRQVPQAQQWPGCSRWTNVLGKLKAVALPGQIRSIKRMTKLSTCLRV